MSGITSGAGSGLDQLLSLLSNPEAYRAQLEELRAAAKVAEDQIALAAPASEILVLREQLKKAKAEQDRIDQETEARVADEIANAKAQAADMLASAHAEADQIRAKAQVELGMAQAVRAEADRRKAEALVAIDSANQARKLGEEAQASARGHVAELKKANEGIQAERERLATLAKKLQADLG